MCYPAAISRVALIGSFSTLQSALSSHPVVLRDHFPKNRCSPC